jgi:hypothetical protein
VTTYQYPQTDRAWMQRYATRIGCLVCVLLTLALFVVPFLLPFNLAVAISIAYLVSRR